MLNDEIVDEVRAIRETHALKFNFNLRAIYEYLKRSEAERIAAGRTRVAVPSPTSGANAGSQHNRFARR
jgi:hypothetical protein